MGIPGEAQTDEALFDEVRRYGHFDVDACYNCGSCVRICNLTKDTGLFPRKSIRYARLGLRERLLSSLEPWLCYYCGDCSKACPRQTEPGESMMTLRRWLTASYDWTGLSARMYKSAAWEIGALVAVAGVTAWIISLMHTGMPAGLTAEGGVRINAFLPMARVHIFDWTLAAVLSFFLLTNVARMWWYTMFRAPDPAPAGSYLEELWAPVWNGATQIRFRDCGNNTARWLKHFLLVSGYGLMFTMVVVFLPWFQVEDLYPLWHPQRWLGYYATAVLIIFTVEILWGRIRKTEYIHKFSDLSDWLFPILLLLTVVTGILTHIYRYLGWPLTTYYMYAAHLMVAVPMLVVEVPFGKWAHMMYRPLAVYFLAVKKNAERKRLVAEAIGAAAPAQTAGTL